MRLITVLNRCTTFKRFVFEGSHPVITGLLAQSANAPVREWGTAASRTPARTGHRRSRTGPGNRPRGQRRSSSERSFLRKSGSGIWNRLADEDGPPSKGLWRLDAVIPNA